MVQLPRSEADFRESLRTRTGDNNAKLTLSPMELLPSQTSDAESREATGTNPVSTSFTFAVAAAMPDAIEAP